METEDKSKDALWPIVQGLYALSGLLQNWNGAAFDYELLPGVGSLIGDIAKMVERIE